MNVKVWDDRYVIKSDSYCYILKEIKKRQPKDEIESGDQEVVENNDGTYEVTIGYPSTIAGCFRKIIELESRNNRCTTLEGYIKHIEKVNQKLEESLIAFEKILDENESLERVLKRIKKKE